MSAAGKNTRLKMKNPMKLWPFRPATRAGQNAMATQMITKTVHQIAGMTAPQTRLACPRSEVPRWIAWDAEFSEGRRLSLAAHAGLGFSEGCLELFGVGTIHLRGRLPHGADECLVDCLGLRAVIDHDDAC